MFKPFVSRQYRSDPGRADLDRSDLGILNFLFSVFQEQAVINNLFIYCGAISWAFREELFNYLMRFMPENRRTELTNLTNSIEGKILNTGLDMILRGKFTGVPAVIHDTTYIIKTAYQLKNNKSIDSKKRSIDQNAQFIEMAAKGLVELGFMYAAVMAINTMTGSPSVGYLAMFLIANFNAVTHVFAKSYQRHGFFAAVGAGLEELAYSVPGGKYFKRYK